MKPNPAVDRLLARRRIALDRALADLGAMQDRVAGMQRVTVDALATRLPRIKPIAGLAADIDRHLAEVAALDGALDDIGVPRRAALS